MAVRVASGTNTSVIEEVARTINEMTGTQVLAVTHMHQAAINLKVDHALAPRSAITEWTITGPYITSAVIRVSVPELIQDRRAMLHEFIHALGFKHTCSWPSIMGGYGCQMASSITTADAAHIAAGLAHAQASRQSAIGWVGVLAGLQATGRQSGGFATW